ncbi:MAG: Gfo/Idh/MocA family protein [Gemmatimonadaceae bacterium]
MADKPALKIALIGYSFMGRAHSNAYQQVNRFFPESPYRVERAVLVGRTPGPLQEAAKTWGWAETSTDIDAVLARPDIDIVDVATPNISHFGLSMRAIEAGKHVLCEKPLAMTAKEARAMAAAASAARTATGAPVRTLLWHNYRRCPAAMTAAQLIAAGKLGTVQQVRAVYLQDWLTDDSCPWLWRHDAATCGSGAHGDLNAHLIDMCRFLTGLEFTEVVGMQQTFISERRMSDGKGKRKVDVDDALLFLARLSNGATASFEASRVAAGHKNYNRIEVNGTRGSLSWNFERMNELEFFSFDDEPSTQGFRTIMCMNGSAHPYAANYWPDGHIIGYEHTFTNTLADYLSALASGTPFRPDFADGAANQEVIDASLESAKRGTWMKVSQSQTFDAPAVMPARGKNPSKTAGITA